MKPVYALFSIIMMTAGLFAQASLTSADYQRAERLLDIRDLVDNLTIQPHWLEDSTGLWYEVVAEGRKEFRRIDFPGLNPSLAFDHERLTRALNESFSLELSADSLPLTNLVFKGDNELEFQVKGQAYVVDLKTYDTQEKEDKREDEAAEFEEKSPDGKWVAFSKGYNLYLRSVETGDEVQLSRAGRRHYEYASYYGWGDIIEGENGRRPPRFTARWSPDSKKILTSICDLRVAEKMYLLDWSVDSLYRPRLLGYYRGSPGDSTMVYIKPVLFNLESGREITVDFKPMVHVASPSLRWTPDGKQLIGYFWERGYKRLHFVRVNATSGAVDTLYTERSETSVNNAYFEFHLLGKSGQILFASEQSGWNQLYLLDIGTGAVRPLTKGEFVVNDVVHVDEEREVVYFTAMGREAGRNIYWQHLYRVGLDDGEVTLLTPAAAHHEVRFSPDGRYFVDNYSTARQPTVTVLQRIADAGDKIELGRADVSRLTESGWSMPETYTVKAEDGQSDIYCTFWKPTHFDPDRSYPIIEHSYTGPHTFTFPTSFSRALSGTNQALSELGFTVVMIAGRGSAGRSKAFRDHSYKRLGFSLGDHVYALKALARELPWLDTSRVGIFGHSAGGYDAAHALLQYPDFYKVAVSSSADHDHRMEKAWWPEMYMGWPVDSAYHQQSNITMAGNLQGKLLITHGGIDENVNPSATFKLSEALIKAGKDFDLLILPSQRHGYRGIYGDYFTKKRWNYFVEHLMGEEPVWDY